MPRIFILFFYMLQIDNCLQVDWLPSRTCRCVKVRKGGQALNKSNELNATQIIIE
jgi:hypothetical protein